MSALAPGATQRDPTGPWACVPRIDQYLESSLRDLGGSAPEALRDAMRYAVMGGGKRLRPVLAWHACEACGVAGEHALRAAAAVELVHSFSLVHDDLPALDNDDLRRGRPTLHKHAGEAMAILTGDALLSGAMELLAGVDPAAAAREMSGELARATRAMIEGQVADTLGEPERAAVTTQERVRSIHERKTGALIVAACRLGVHSAAAKAGRAFETALSDVTEYARSLGLLFQITDDLLDVTGTPEQTGKRTRKDAQAGKLTFPGVFGVDRARAMVRELEAEAVEAASRFANAGGQMLAVIARQMADRTA